MRRLMTTSKKTRTIRMRALCKMRMKRMKTPSSSKNLGQEETENAGPWASPS
jgi:hypothetical protein